MKREIIVSTLTCALLLFGPLTSAADQERVQTQNQAQVYGSQLMTKQERNEYRNKIKTAKTAKEREQIRHEHHQLMTKRAKKQGITLPDKPPAMGSHRGMGPKDGMGPRDGMRPKGGMGPRDGSGGGQNR